MDRHVWKQRAMDRERQTCTQRHRKIEMERQIHRDRKTGMGPTSGIT